MRNTLPLPSPANHNSTSWNALNQTARGNQVLNEIDQLSELQFPVEKWKGTLFIQCVAVAAAAADNHDGDDDDDDERTTQQAPAEA